MRFSYLDVIKILLKSGLKSELLLLTIIGNKQETYAKNDQFNLYFYHRNL